MARVAATAALVACLVGVTSVAPVECSGDYDAIFAPLVIPGVDGKVEDATCDIQAVEVANAQQLHTVLEALMNTRFFSLFRVNLKKKCMFWQEKPIEKCSAGLPKKKATPFMTGGGGGLGASPPPATSSVADGAAGAKAKAKAEAKAVTKCSLSTEGSLPAIPFSPTTNFVDKSGLENVKSAKTSKASNDCNVPEFWLDLCKDIPSDESEYINLQNNPERYTGFNGAKIWSSIYNENCFTRTGDLQQMCYEERVLYRMLSGMHSSINIHIAMNWYPPRKGKRVKFAPNPSRLSALFKDHPDRLKNMHFAFVVMLRAIRKASPELYKYDTSLGNRTEDATTRTLMHRLLDTPILTSCTEVFEAFDESLLFKSKNNPLPLNSLKHLFKDVFMNISRVLDCVTCQTCKLHGKMELLGMGTALKILLLPENYIGDVLTREEVVALINTVGKFSHAITGARKLFKLDLDNWGKRVEPPPPAKPIHVVPNVKPKQKEQPPPPPPPPPAPPRTILLPSEPQPLAPLQGTELADLAVSLVSRLSASGKVSEEEEDTLVMRALGHDATLLILAKHYSHNPVKFLKYARARVVQDSARVPTLQHDVAAASASASASVAAGGGVKPKGSAVVDAIIVGAGLAGLTATVTLVDRGANVILLDKQKFTGGNSAYASSGINAVDPNDPAEGDSFKEYHDDTARSAGIDANATATMKDAPPGSGSAEGSAASAETAGLISVLTSRSHQALDFIRKRVGLPLPKKGQLGGHSFARTYRPTTGMAGSEMVFALTKIVKKLASGPQLKTMLGTRVKDLILHDDGSVRGVRIESTDQKGVVTEQTLYAANVILATGGYASDQTGTSLLKQHRPDLARFATTNGVFATGDGHKLAVNAGAKAVNLDQVQVHPTAFVDRKHPNATRLTLCAEILRGVGAILLDKKGQRFADELGKRDYVTGRMVERQPDQPWYTILLNQAGAEVANKHVPHYMKKGLLSKVDSLADAAKWIGVTHATLTETLAQYHAAAAAGKDAFGKKFFHNAEFASTSGPFYVGTVTPALHYCMGGVAIDAEAHVLKNDGSIFKGLYAAGEITGGVHGVNRLGGNALTECVVFGQVVGEGIKIGEAAASEPAAEAAASVASVAAPNTTTEAAASTEAPGSTLRKIGKAELGLHNTEEDCWIAVYGKVYDFTDFVPEHPGGIESMVEVAGVDGTEVFESIHSEHMLDDFDPIGVFEES